MTAVESIYFWDQGKPAAGYRVGIQITLHHLSMSGWLMLQQVFPIVIEELVFEAHKFNVDAHDASEGKTRRSRPISKVLELVCNKNIQSEIFLPYQPFP